MSQLLSFEKIAQFSNEIIEKNKYKNKILAH